MTMQNYKMMKWTDENIKKFWNYESNFPENYFTYYAGEEIIKKVFSYTANAKMVLDFGCGAGFLIPHLLKNNLLVYGLDFSEDSITKVNERFKNFKNFKGVFSYTHFLDSNDKFDLIFAIEVIEHLDDDKLSSTIKFMKNHLSSEGAIIFTTPNEEDLKKSYIYCPESDVVFHRWQHVRSWSEEKLSEYLKREFSEVITFTTNFNEKPNLLKLVKHIIKYILKKQTNSKNPHLVAIVKHSL